jgi:hypothetical protein
VDVPVETAVLPRRLDVYRRDAGYLGYLFL